jgi:hypothetical protein
MLTYTLNSRYFVLSEGTTVKLSFLNPACNHRSIKGDAGLGVDIPVNEYNRAILGNPERFEKYTAGADRRFPGFEIRYGGVLLLSGTLIIKGATKDAYSGWLQSNAGVLKEETQEKNITEFAWPEDQTFQNKASYNEDDDDYCTTMILNRGFWDGKGKEEAVKTPYTDANGTAAEKEETRSQMAQFHLDNYAWYVNNHALPTVEPGLVIQPYLYLRYVIRESLRLNGFYINRNEMLAGTYSLSMWYNAHVYNNFNIVDMAPTTEIRTEENFNPGTYEFEQNLINEITGFNWALLPFDYKRLLPKVKYADFLLGIQNYLNFVFVFRTDGKVDIIDRNQIPELDAIDLSGYHTGFWEIGERKDVTLKFISEYDDNDGNFDNEFEDLSERRTDYGEPVADYAALLALTSPEIGEMRLVKSLNRIYEYKWKSTIVSDAVYNEKQFNELGWEFLSSGPQPYFYGTAAEVEEIKTPVSTLQMVSGPLVAIPEVIQKGNLSSTRNAYIDFTPRLMTGSALLWPEGMYWEGDNGLFKTSWEKWARFWKNRLEVSAEFDLPMNMLYHIKENITGKFRTREGEFIIEEMEVTIGMNSIGRAKVRGYKI